MLSFKYKLYRNRRTAYLDDLFEEAAHTWNRALAIQRRYYAIYKKHIQCSRMKEHFAKRSTRKLLNSCTMQEILERQELAFVRFFDKKVKRPPKFKKPGAFRTIVFKGDTGYKLNGNEIFVKKIAKKYKFSYSRPFYGAIKRVHITKSPSGGYYLYIITDAKANPLQKTHNGASVGMDFGLKTFLTLSTGESITYPRYLEKGLNRIRAANLNFSEQPTERRRIAMAREYERVRNRRADWQWKLAHELCRRFDSIYVEDLSVIGMSMVGKWGRKVSDSAYALFLERLGHVSSKYGVYVGKISRRYPSSRTCSYCGYINKSLSLRDRIWTCPSCGNILDRDINAAINIRRQGIVSPKSVRKTTSVAERDTIRKSEIAEYVKAVEIPLNV